MHLKGNIAESLHYWKITVIVGFVALKNALRSTKMKERAGNCNQYFPKVPQRRNQMEHHVLAVLSQIPTNNGERSILLMTSSKLPRTIIYHNGTFCCTVETYQIHFVSWKNYMLPLCHRWIGRAHWTMAYWFTIKFPHLAIILICNVPLAQLQKSNILAQNMK